LFCTLINRLITIIALFFAASLVIAGPSAAFAPPVEAGEIAMPTTAEYVERQVDAYFSDIPIMREIAECESHKRHYNSNGSVLRGRVNPDDIGVMQINLIHKEKADELGLNLFSLGDNLAYARYLHDTQGTRPWKYSKKCWGQYEHLAAN